MGRAIADVALTERELVDRLEASGALDKMRAEVANGVDAYSCARGFVEDTIQNGDLADVASLALPFMDEHDVLLRASSDSFIYANVCDAIRDTYAGHEPEMFDGGVLPSVRRLVEALVEENREYEDFAVEMEEPTLGGEADLTELADQVLHDALDEMPQDELVEMFLGFCDPRTAAGDVYVSNRAASTIAALLERGA